MVNEIEYRGYTLVSNDVGTNIWNGPVWIQCVYGANSYLTIRYAMVAIDFHLNTRHP